MLQPVVVQFDYRQFHKHCLATALHGRRRKRENGRRGDHNVVVGMQDRVAGGGLDAVKGLEGDDGRIERRNA